MALGHIGDALEPIAGTTEGPACRPRDLGSHALFPILDGRRSLWCFSLFAFGVRRKFSQGGKGWF